MGNKSKFRRIDWSRILVEMISVVFAVLLALFLNEWRNSVRENHQLAEARANMTLELRHNLSETEVKLSEHRKQLKELEQLKDSIGKFKLPISEYRFGVGILNLQEASWRSITLTKVVNKLEFEELNRFSELYRSFELVNKLQDGYMQVAFSLDFNKAENSELGYLATKNHLVQMISWEEELIEEIKACL